MPRLRQISEACTNSCHERKSNPRFLTLAHLNPASNSLYVNFLHIPIQIFSTNGRNVVKPSC